MGSDPEEKNCYPPRHSSQLRFWYGLQAREGFPGGSDGKASAVLETQVRSLGWEDPLEKEMAIHSSTLAWKIPWTEEPSRLA